MKACLLGQVDCVCALILLQVGDESDDARSRRREVGLRPVDARTSPTMDRSVLGVVRVSEEVWAIEIPWFPGCKIALMGGVNKLAIVPCKPHVKIAVALLDVAVLLVASRGGSGRFLFCASGLGARSKCRLRIRW